MERDAIRSITLTLDVGGDVLLFIHLDDTDRISRMGNGEAGRGEVELVEGTTGRGLFATLRETVSDEMLDAAGSYDMPDPAGEPCKLQIVLQGDGDRVTGLEFHYGTESEGPPREVADFVVTALELTEPWYRAQQPGPDDDNGAEDIDDGDDDDIGDNPLPDGD